MVWRNAVGDKKSKGKQRKARKERKGLGLMHVQRGSVGVLIRDLCGPVENPHRESHEGGFLIFQGGERYFHNLLRQKPACCLLHAGFLIGLLFNPADGGDTFL
jgi:hypothetical protein